jgi:hypothetical protein
MSKFNREFERVRDYLWRCKAAEIPRIFALTFFVKFLAVL